MQTVPYGLFTNTSTVRKATAVVVHYLFRPLLFLNLSSTIITKSAIFVNKDSVIAATPLMECKFAYSIYIFSGALTFKIDRPFSKTVLVAMQSPRRACCKTGSDSLILQAL